MHYQLHLLGFVCMRSHYIYVPLIYPKDSDGNCLLIYKERFYFQEILKSKLSPKLNLFVYSIINI